MGSCYSTKAAQMPQPGDNKKLSPPSSSSPAQRKLIRPSSQKGKGTSSGFGFNKQNAGKRPVSSEVTVINNSNEMSKRHSNDALRTVQDSATDVQKSPKSRFGFKKPSIKGVSKSSQKFDSAESLNSNKSDVSKGSYRSREVKPPGSTGSQRKNVYSGKPGLLHDSKNLKMIDDTESSQSDLLSSDIKAISVSDTSKVQNNAPVDDDVNANIPNKQTQKSVTQNKNRNSDSEYPTNTSHNKDLNGNQNEIHSTSSVPKESSAKATAEGRTIVSRLPSKFKRPFVKSKTFSGPSIDPPDKHEDLKMKPSSSRDSVLSKQNTSKAAATSVKKQPSTRTSFLKRGFFSRQKSSPSPSENSSQNKSDDVSAKKKNTHSTNDNVSPKSKDKKPSINTQVEQKQESIVPDNIDGNKSDTGSNEVFEKISISEMKDLDTEKDQKSETIEKLQSSIPLNLKEKLEQAHIPKGVAPIAMLDSAETTSIGSITSDDLMLDMDIDLGPYDDDDEETTQSIHSQSVDKSSFVIRNRSRSGSGRVRSRSKSHEKVPVKETKSYQSNEMVDSGIDSSTSATIKPKPAIAFQNRANISATGIEKRENWYRKRYNSQSKADEENESVDELHQLIDLQKPVQRRFATNDKAIRPASFPGGIQKQISDPIPRGMMNNPPAASSHVLRPPRIPSVSDDDRMSLDGHTYRHMAQDMTALKTMLLKLKRIIQDDELGSPMGTPSWKNGLSFSSSQPGSPFAKFADRTFGFADSSREKEQQTNLVNVLKENDELKSQVHVLKQQVEEQEKTIKLLQQQMTKYEDSSYGSSFRDKPKNGTTTNNRHSGEKMSAKRSLQYNSNSTSVLQNKQDKATTNTGKKYGASTTGRSRPVTSIIIPDTNESCDQEDVEVNISSPIQDACHRLVENGESDNNVSDSLHTTSSFYSSDNQESLDIQNETCDSYVKNEETFDSILPHSHNVQTLIYEAGVKSSYDSAVKSRKEMYSCNNVSVKSFSETEPEIIVNGSDSIVKSDIGILNNVNENENLDPNVISETSITTKSKLVNSNSDSKISKPKSVSSRKKPASTGLPVPSGLPRYGSNSKGAGKPQQSSKLPGFGNVKKVARPQVQLKSFVQTAPKS